MKKTLLLFIILTAASFHASAIRNPAAVYCVESGYSYEIQETSKGQVGICKFPDASICNAWDFLRGNCGLDHSSCMMKGLGQRKATGLECDSKDPQTQCLVCIFPDGSTVEVTKLLESLDRSICGNGICQWNENFESCPRDCMRNNSFAEISHITTTTRPPENTSSSIWRDAGISDGLFYTIIMLSGAFCYLLIYRFFKIREDKRRNG